jgi:hypothetical protein
MHALCNLAKTYSPPIGCILIAFIVRLGSSPLSRKKVSESPGAH